MISTTNEVGESANGRSNSLGYHSFVADTEREKEYNGHVLAPGIQIHNESDEAAISTPSWVFTDLPSSGNAPRRVETFESENIDRILQPEQYFDDEEENDTATSEVNSSTNHYQTLLQIIDSLFLSSDISKLLDWARGKLLLDDIPDKVIKVLRQLDDKEIINASNLCPLRDFFESILRYDLVHIIDEFLLGNYDVFKIINMSSTTSEGIGEDANDRPNSLGYHSFVADTECENFEEYNGHVLAIGIQIHDKKDDHREQIENVQETIIELRNQILILESQLQQAVAKLGRLGFEMREEESEQIISSSHQHVHVQRRKTSQTIPNKTVKHCNFANTTHAEQRRPVDIPDTSESPASSEQILDSPETLPPVPDEDNENANEQIISPDAIPSPRLPSTDLLSSGYAPRRTGMLKSGSIDRSLQPEQYFDNEEKNDTATHEVNSLTNHYQTLLQIIDSSFLLSDIPKLLDWARNKLSLDDIPDKVIEVLRLLDQNEIIKESNLCTLRDFLKSILRLDLVHTIDEFLFGNYDVFKMY